MPKRFRVLIVDDDEIVRNFLVELLAAKGHACEAAADGRLALDIMRSRGFDAVVADIIMPELDGIALTRELLRLHPRLRVMVMTGFRGEFTAEEALQAGARKFIFKPFSVRDFYREFEEMMMEPGAELERDKS